MLIDLLISRIPEVIIIVSPVPNADGSKAITSPLPAHVIAALNETDPVSFVLMTMAPVIVILIELQSVSMAHPPPPLTK